MKITIKEGESYEIEVPEEVDKKDFVTLVGRLNTIVAMMNLDKESDRKSKPKDEGVETETAVKRRRKKKYVSHNVDRDSAKEILHTWFTNRDGLEPVMQKYGVDIHYVYANKKKWMQQYSFTPDELGLPNTA